MRKIISAITVIALLCALSTTAFATTINGSTKSSSHDVMAKSNGSVATPAVYSVDVEWGTMEFTYNVGGTKNWNPANHNYTDEFSASWSAVGNKVTVTNHSNKSVTAAFGFTKDSTVTEAITGAFDVTSKQLDAGVIGAYTSADKVTSALTLNGTLDSARTTLTKIGTVTVTID